MANYIQKLAKDAAYQSHTGRLTGLWFLPKLALGLNTNYLLTNSPLPDPILRKLDLLHTLTPYENKIYADSDL